MIILYDRAESDFSHNGVKVLDRYIMSSMIHEELNGEYTLEMELTESCGVQAEMIIKAPAPTRYTPQIEMTGTSGGSTEIYRITGGTVNLRTGPGTKYKILKVYRRNTLMVLLEKTSSSWYKVAAPDGNAGYMSTTYLEYVRTDYEPPTTSGVIEPRKSRDQLFRVSKIVPTLEGVQVHAEHIYYDQRRNFVMKASVNGLTGAQAIQAVSGATMYEHDFVYYSDIAGSCPEDIAAKNPAEALLGDDGLVAQLGGEVLRDNFDVYWTQNIGANRGVSIAYRKNMTGMEVEIDTSNVVTRIIPVGYDKEGNEILLNEIYVDSPLIGDYATPCISRIEYRDVKVGDIYNDAEAVRAELARLAAAEFAAGIDKPSVSASVQYVDLKNTSVGKGFAHYTNVYLGDTVYLRHEDYGLDIATKVTAYDWDPVLEEYIEINIGTGALSMSSIQITPGQIADGSLSGRKITGGSVGSPEIGQGAVQDDHIANEGISAVKIKNLEATVISAVTAHLDKVIAGEITTDEMYAAIAEITQLSVGELEVDAAQIKDLEAAVIAAVQAKIDQIIAGNLTTDELYASLAEIGVMRAGQVTAENVTTDELAAAYAEIVALLVDNISADNIETDRLGAALARFVTLHAGTAEFDFATIQNLVARALSLEQASADSVYIKNLAVTSANLLSATIGKLVLRGDDGKYYAVFVGADGTIHAEEVTVTDAEISAGQTDSGRQIVETDMNVAGLNATNIQASSAVINSILTTALSAGSITAGDALIASATIPALYATSIKSIGDSLDLSANESMRVYVQEQTAVTADELGTDMQNNYNDLKSQIDAQAGAIEDAAGQSAANAGEIAAMTERISGIEIEQGKINLGFETRIGGVEDVNGALEERVTTIERGVSVEESEAEGVIVTIYASDKSVKLQATPSGLAILPAGGGQAQAVFDITGASVPRLQVDDRILVGPQTAWVVLADGTSAVMGTN